MFNIKKSIYVSYPEEVTLTGNQRTIMLWQGAESEAKSFRHKPASKDDPFDKGVVFAYDSVLHMMAVEFDGKVENFYKWLNSESNLYILTRRDEDYSRMFTYYLSELKYAYGLSNQHTLELLNAQHLKDYFSNRPKTFTILDGWRSVGTGVYKPLGGFLDNADELSFEVVVYLYHHKYISKEIGDQKIGSVSLIMLQGLVRSVTANIRNDLAINRKVLREYLNDVSIDTVTEAISVIDTDPFLRGLFFGNSTLNFSDPLVLEKVKRWTTICVHNELDYPEERSRRKYEHDLFYELFETSDIDIVIDNITPFSHHQFIGERRGKFNDVILTTLYPNSKHRSGKFEVWKSEADNQWCWHLKATNGQIIAESEGYKTKKAANNGIASVKSNADLAQIVEL